MCPRSDGCISAQSRVPAVAASRTDPIAELNKSDDADPPTASSEATADANGTSPVSTDSVEASTAPEQAGDTAPVDAVRATAQALVEAATAQAVQQTAASNPEASPGAMQQWIEKRGPTADTVEAICEVICTLVPEPAFSSHTSASRVSRVETARGAGQRRRGSSAKVIARGKPQSPITGVWQSAGDCTDERVAGVPRKPVSLHHACGLPREQQTPPDSGAAFASTHSFPL
jgi:hypothetical protein